MGELILHIGTPKTGTTALQQFFFKNRKRLASHSVIFPSFTKQPKTPLAMNGIVLNRYCQRLSEGRNPSVGIANLEANLRKLSKLLASNERVLLSDETIYNNSNKSHETTSPYWPTMARILDEAGADDVTVVVYLRRQDDWASSHWRQRAKSGYGADSFAAHLNDPQTGHRMNYAGTIEAIERAFGNAVHIVVRRYDRKMFEGGDIYHDFCLAAGIPWDDGYRLPDAAANTSLSLDVAEALRTFQDAAPPKTPLRTDVLIPLARELSKKYPDAPGTTPFDEEATRSLMEPHLEGNRRISERYLDGAPLFSEEYGGRPVWTPNEGRIAECRAAFEEAISQYEPPSNGEGVLLALARKLPEGVKQPLRAVRERLLNR